MVESLENVYKHCDKVCEEGEDLCSTFFHVEMNENNIKVFTENTIRNANIKPLKEKIDSVNSLSRVDLKKYYKESIINNNITEKGGAGLGIIDMVKVSGNKLYYEFRPINNNFSVFHLAAKVSFYNMNGMDAKIIEATEKSPKVTFDPGKGLFEMEGDSRPENVRKFYQPIIDMLKGYFDKLSAEKGLSKYDDEPFKFNFQLGYFNSSSAKFILDVLTIVNDYRLEGLTIKVNWYFEEDDEDMQEAGEEFSNFIDYPFNYIMIKED